EVAVGAQKLFDLPVGRVVYPLAQGLQQQKGIERIDPQLYFQCFEARMVTAGKRRLRLVILAALLGETVGMRWLTDRQQYSAQQAGEAGQASSQWQRHDHPARMGARWCCHGCSDEGLITA